MKLGLCLIITSCVIGVSHAESFKIPDTGQYQCFGNREEIACPQNDEYYFGQDAQYQTNKPTYRDNGDGTISDLVTGLMWQKVPDFQKRDQASAEKYAKRAKVAGYSDWRLPTIKELFSIADFNGNMHSKTPYIDTSVFDFKYPSSRGGYGNRPGNRGMDAQYATSTHYKGITMGRDRSAFGFNFADGRIKSYPTRARRYVRLVRGNPVYGRNRFVDNGDGTISDLATGLMWQKGDSQQTLNWDESLFYAEDLNLAGHTDWRLPNIKELQSIVDYSKAPDALNREDVGPAIDSIFSLSNDESWFWSSTTHIENGFAYYVSFGQAFSARFHRGSLMNAHGAGAVRSDPKEGNPSRWSGGLGPQSDQIRIYNYVRCVRIIR
jgi:hypothetical protein